MEQVKPLYVKNRDEWRAWLLKNHEKEKEAWLLYYKKHTKKPTILYDDAVEGALCFGWIDGKVRSIDSEKYMQRFTPRGKKSVWSLLNKKRAEKMIKEKKMTKTGLNAINEAKKSGAWENAYTSRVKMEIFPQLKKALQKNKKAWDNFNNFSRYRYRVYILFRSVLFCEQFETA